MALTLGLEHPERFVAVGSHSGAAPHSAVTPAGRADHARPALPDAEPIARALNGRAAPPLLLIHGDFDPVVSFANAETSAGLWADLLPEGTKMSVASGEIRRGSRRASPGGLEGGAQTYVRLLRVHGMGHAWSGGAAGQAFSDPSGPDALRLAWQFFER
jgi:poly(3-hydroxybutyrate) depolymerase